MLQLWQLYAFALPRGFDLSCTCQTVDLSCSGLFLLHAQAIMRAAFDSLARTSLCAVSAVHGHLEVVPLLLSRCITPVYSPG